MRARPNGPPPVRAAKPRPAGARRPLTPPPAVAPIAWAMRICRGRGGYLRRQGAAEPPLASLDLHPPLRFRGNAWGIVTSGEAGRGVRPKGTRHEGHCISAIRCKGCLRMCYSDSFTTSERGGVAGERRLHPVRAAKLPKDIGTMRPAGRSPRGLAPARRRPGRGARRPAARRTPSRCPFGRCGAGGNPRDAGIGSRTEALEKARS